MSTASGRTAFIGSSCRRRPDVGSNPSSAPAPRQQAEDETGTGDSLEDGPFPIKGSDKQFVMDWTTEEHTDVSVPVTAEGPGAEALTGQRPNTYVHEVLSGGLGL